MNHDHLAMAILEDIPLGRFHPLRYDNIAADWVSSSWGWHRRHRPQLCGAQPCLVQNFLRMIMLLLPARVYCLTALRHPTLICFLRCRLFIVVTPQDWEIPQPLLIV
jgi:hypothetical protein